VNDEILTGQIVPFGKYEGRPVAELAADDSYREWVLSQPWVREKWGSFYQVLVHGGPPPEHSPEHNEMQARFLDDSWCLGLARLLPGMSSHGLDKAVKECQAWREKNLAANPDLVMQCAVSPPAVSSMHTEDHGWDVTFEYEPGAITQSWSCGCTSVPAGEWREPLYPGGALYPEKMTAEAWQEDRGKPHRPKEPLKPYPPVQGYPPQGPGYPPQGPPPGYSQASLENYQEKWASYRRDLEELPGKILEYERRLAVYRDHRHYALDHCQHEDIFQVRHRPRLLAAELKPDLGDDYPAVLRQVQKYLIRRVSYGYGRYGDVPTCDAAFLVVRRARFTSVTWDQVVKIFARSGIIMVPESWLKAPA
jgi:hypothetical protein